MQEDELFLKEVHVLTPPAHVELLLNSCICFTHSPLCYFGQVQKLNHSGLLYNSRLLVLTNSHIYYANYPHSGPYPPPPKSKASLSKAKGIRRQQQSKVFRLQFFDQTNWEWEFKLPSEQLFRVWVGLIQGQCKLAKEQARNQLQPLPSPIEGQSSAAGQYNDIRMLLQPLQEMPRQYAIKISKQSSLKQSLSIHAAQGQIRLIQRQPQLSGISKDLVKQPQIRISQHPKESKREPQLQLRNKELAPQTKNHLRKLQQSSRKKELTSQAQMQARFPTNAKELEFRAYRLQRIDSQLFAKYNSLISNDFNYQWIVQFQQAAAGKLNQIPVLAKFQGAAFQLVDSLELGPESVINSQRVLDNKIVRIAKRSTLQYKRMRKQFAGLKYLANKLLRALRYYPDCNFLTPLATLVTKGSYAFWVEELSPRDQARQLTQRDQEMLSRMCRLQFSGLRCWPVDSQYFRQLAEADLLLDVDPDFGVKILEPTGFVFPADPRWKDGSVAQRPQVNLATLEPTSDKANRVRRLCEQLESYGPRYFSSREFSQCFHRLGVNMRELGSCASGVRQTELRSQLHCEMLARRAKVMYYATECRQLEQFQDFVDILVGDEELSVKLRAQIKSGGVQYYESAEMGEVHWRQVVARFIEGTSAIFDFSNSQALGLKKNVLRIIDFKQTIQPDQFNRLAPFSGRVNARRLAKVIRVLRSGDFYSAKQQLQRLFDLAQYWIGESKYLCFGGHLIQLASQLQGEQILTLRSELVKGLLNYSAKWEGTQYQADVFVLAIRHYELHCQQEQFATVLEAAVLSLQIHRTQSRSWTELVKVVSEYDDSPQLLFLAVKACALAGDLDGQIQVLQQLSCRDLTKPQLEAVVKWLGDVFGKELQLQQLRQALRAVRQLTGIPRSQDCSGPQRLQQVCAKLQRVNQGTNLAQFVESLMLRTPQSQQLNRLISLASH